MSETIKEFLISLGFEANKSGQKEFESAITSATLKAKLLADGLEELARKTLDSVSEVAVNFDRLFYQAQRTNTAAATVSDFVKAMAQAGISASEAAGAFESMAAKLRAGSIAVADINRMGYGLNPLTGQIEVQRQYVLGMTKLSDANVVAGAALIGESAEVGRAMKRQGAAILANLDELVDYRHALGFDFDKAIRDGNKFETIWRDTANKLSLIYDDTHAGLTTAMIAPLQVFNDFLTEHATEIGADIKIIMDALLKMTTAWAADFDKWVKDPVAMNAFQASMQDIANNIADMAASFKEFIVDLRWLIGLGAPFADILNHLTGKKESGTGWNDAVKGISDRAAQSNLNADGSEPPTMWGAIKNFYARRAPIWAGGNELSNRESGAGSSAGNLTKLISEASVAEGIDPRIMEGIRAGESHRNSEYDKVDNAIESSWGPFQLNRKRGLGVSFEKDTGLDVRNPATIPAQARWVARYIREHNGTNGQWMGFNRVGPQDADPSWGESGYVPTARAAVAPIDLSEAGAARAYLASVSSHPNRPGDTSNLNPAFAISLAGAIKDARAKGLNVGMESGFRTNSTTGSAYDAAGYSGHGYGIDADVSGMGGQGSASALQWAQIAEAHGLHNPYGQGNIAEYNHWQMQPGKLERDPLINQIIGKSPQEAWKILGLPGEAAAKPAPSASLASWNGLGSERPSLGGAAPAPATTVHAPMDTKIIIDGSSGDPTPAAHMVAAHITQQPADLTRNLQGATY